MYVYFVKTEQNNSNNRKIRSEELHNFFLLKRYAYVAVNK